MWIAGGPYPVRFLIVECVGSSNGKLTGLQLSPPYLYIYILYIHVHIPVVDIDNTLYMRNI